MYEFSQEIYDENMLFAIDAIKDVMKGMPKTIIEKAINKVKKSKTENQIGRIVTMIISKYMDLYEQVYDCIDRKNKRIDIEGTQIDLYYANDNVCIDFMDRYTYTLTLPYNENTYHRITCRILSYVLKKNSKIFE